MSCFHTRRYLQILLWVIVATIGLTGCTDDDWSSTKINETKLRGNIIISALNKYHGDHGTYPADLQFLVPEHLDTIAPPMVGTQTWKYWTWTTDDITIFYLLAKPEGESGYPMLQYASRTGKWEYTKDS